MESKFNLVHQDQISWESSPLSQGVEVKRLCQANGETMELYKFAPNTTYPDHFHEGPEFVFLLEGSARQNGKWLSVGSASVGETGSMDKDFLSGPEGCLFLTVYHASRYIDP